jgi:hypothetical protein
MSLASTLPYWKFWQRCYRGRIMPLASNIGWSGRRRRYILAGSGLALGLVLAAALVLGGAPQGARFLVFLPFAFGALGILQARGHT